MITGITGQDGSYLAELLLEKGYEVHGIVRRVALEDQHRRLSRIHHLTDKIILHPGSVENKSCLVHIVERVRPDECYHLAAQSFVPESFQDPYSTFDVNINGTLHMLSALKEHARDCRFYFAGSSEMFGKVEEAPQNEKTKFHPRSPYGISKVTGFYLTRNFRESYNMFTCSGILFNHESPRRGMEFVTRKIAHGIAEIVLGKKQELRLGNLMAQRDWGYAPDYVRAMWLMLQQNEPDDYVIATGEKHSVEEFVRETARRIGLEHPEKYVISDPSLLREAEVDSLVGDATKAHNVLDWKPEITFRELVHLMADAEMEALVSRNT